MIAATAGILLPLPAVVLLLRRLGGPPGWRAHAAVPFAVGLASAWWWALQLLPLHSRSVLIGADACFWTLAALTLYRLKRCAPAAPTPHRAAGPVPWLEWTVLASTCGLAVLSFAASSAVMPHGEWDAWAIWNLRARFLFLGYPSYWRDAFSPLLTRDHLDYPLLLPLSVARGWMYLGRESTVVPIAIAAAFAASTVVVAASSVLRERSRSRGLLTAAAILASPAFVRYASSQCADIPLAFYVLVTVLSMGDGLRSPSARSPWIAAGLSAGLAAWTKNEGLLFLVLCAAAAGIAPASRTSRIRRVGHVLLGAAPIVAGLMFLKSFAWQNDVLAPQTVHAVLVSLGDVDRVRTVCIRMGRELWFGGTHLIGVLPAVGVFVLVSGVRKPLDSGPLIGLALSAAMVLTYAIIYILTPYDLTWHLNTSLDRVLLHVFPTVVWSGMMMARQ